MVPSEASKTKIRRKSTLRIEDPVPDIELPAVTTGRNWSFGQINEAANAVAEGLLGRGLLEGDRVAILCQNRAEFFITLFACQKTGLILCPLNWRQPAPELVEPLEQVGVSALITDKAFEAVARETTAALGTDLLSIESDLAGWIEAGSLFFGSLAIS